MAEVLSVSPYELTWSQFERPRLGFLIRLQKDHNVGFADVHPWPEFDEPDLNQQIESLKKGRPLLLSTRALERARRDARARQEGRSLLTEEVIQCHRLYFSLSEISHQSLEADWNEGFRTLKLKVGKDLKEEIRFFHSYEQSLNCFRIRLDFNARLDGEDFQIYLEQMGSSLAQCIEYVEDPFELPHGTRQTLPVAVDLAWNSQASSADYWVIKPMHLPREFDRLSFSPHSQFVFTHSFEHPLGLSHAVSCFQDFKRRGLMMSQTHGLIPRGLHGDFAENPLRYEGSRLCVSSLLGAGFGSYLMGLDWKEIYAGSLS